MLLLLTLQRANVLARLSLYRGIIGSSWEEPRVVLPSQPSSSLLLSSPYALSVSPSFLASARLV